MEPDKAPPSLPVDAAVPNTDAAAAAQLEVDNDAVKEIPVNDEAEEASDEDVAKEPAVSADAGRDITNTLARRVLPVLQGALVSSRNKK